MKPLTISLIQSDIYWEQKERNLDSLTKKISALPQSQVVLLPEMFATGFTINTNLAEKMEGMVMTWMKEMAKTFRKIIAGTVLIQDNNQFFNRLIWMQPNGQYYLYDKRHLFSYAKEDEVFQAGNQKLIVQVNGWKINLQVCYDLRFPVWSRQTIETYDILINLANWPEKRIHAWDILLQARAIENLSFVVGVNRVGEDDKNNSYCGNSLIVSPLGEVIMKGLNAESIFTYTFKKELLLEVRAQYPFLLDADQFLVL